MKKILATLLLTASLARGAVVYSGPQNIGVPVTFDGVYVNLFTGATASTQPGTWNTAPWINPFFGGVDIGTSLLLRPVITGVSQVMNLAPGSMVSAASNFAAGESGSTTHVGPAANQFQLGTPGYLGFVFQTAPAGPDYYGWAQLTVNNTGAGGTLVDWAYDDAPGTAIAVPEPGRAALGLAGLAAAGLVRRRPAKRRARSAIGRGNGAVLQALEGVAGPVGAPKGQQEGSCGQVFGGGKIGLEPRDSAIRENLGTFSPRAGLTGMGHALLPHRDLLRTPGLSTAGRPEF